jgi:hypothetical protein
MGGVDERVFELAAADDQDSVEVFAAECAHPAFGVGVCVVARMGVRMTVRPSLWKKGVSA